MACQLLMMSQSILIGIHFGGWKLKKRDWKLKRKNISNSSAQKQVLKQMIIFRGSIAQLLTITTAG